MRQTNPDTQILAELASDLIDAGEWQQVRAVTRQLVEIDPEEPRHHCALGISLMHLDDPNGAEKCLRTALEKGGENVHVLLMMARLYNQRGDPGGQLEWAQRAAKCGGDNPDALLAVADAQVRLGQLAEAEEVLKELCAAHPGNVQARRMLGDICLSLQKIDEAAQEFQAALEDDPADASLLMNLGKHQEAEACFRRNLNLIAPTFFNLGMTLFRQKRYQESLDMFQRAHEIIPGDPEYLDLVGNAYMELGRLPEARDALNAALAADDTDWDGLRGDPQFQELKARATTLQS